MSATDSGAVKVQVIQMTLTQRVRERLLPWTSQNAASFSLWGPKK